MKGLVSVIIPYYNAEKYIKKCLDSIVESSYKNIEIIVVIDFDDDVGKAVLSKLSHLYPQMIYIIQDDSGVSNARNFWISHAKWEFLMFVDADDFIDKDFIKNLVENIWDNDVIIWWYNEIFENYIKTRIPSKKNWFQYKYMTVRWKIYRTEVIKSNNLKFIKIDSEDIIFCMELYNITNKVTSLSYVWYNYLSNPKSLVHTVHTKYNSIDTFKLINIILTKCKDRNFLMKFSLYKILLLDLRFSFFWLSLLDFMKRSKKLFKLFWDNRIYVFKYNRSEPLFINLWCWLCSLFIYIFY